jgi:Tol biopolymer transport system component
MRTATGPDGTRIAFTSNRDGDFEVWVMNADGTNPINLARKTPDAALTTSKASPSPQST